MSDGQWRVVVLLIVLLGLEILRNTTVRAFLRGIFVTPFKKGASG
jgi:hypothetical protein